MTHGALKKSLGQHLLKDRNFLAKMVRLAGLGKADLVVEIGPGQGDLTRCVAKGREASTPLRRTRGSGTCLSPWKESFRT